jgi:hypothetical protein
MGELKDMLKLRKTIQFKGLDVLNNFNEIQYRKSLASNSF